MQARSAFKMVVLAAAVAAGAVIAGTRVQAQGTERPGDRVFAGPVLPAQGSRIGISIRDLTADDQKNLKLSDSAGVVVGSVEPNSPAGSAGIRTGDVIVEFDGERVRSARQLTRLVLDTPAGRPVKVGLVRDGRRTDLTVTPAEAQAGQGLLNPQEAERLRQMASEMRSSMQRGMESGGMMGQWGPGAGGPAPRPGRLGVNVQPLTPDLASYFGVKSGVLVASVNPDSPAAKAGVKAGDVMTAVDGKPVSSAADITGAMGDASTAKDLTLSIVRDKKDLSLKARIEAVAPNRVNQQAPRGRSL
jgi:serine protease Do